MFTKKFISGIRVDFVSPIGKDNVRQWYGRWKNEFVIDEGMQRISFSLSRKEKFFIIEKFFCFAFFFLTLGSGVADIS